MSEREQYGIPVLEEEDKYLGMKSSFVPTVNPGENPNAAQDWDCCNAKKVDVIPDYDEKGSASIFKGFCENKAGAGTDHLGEGRCKWHGGQCKGPGLHSQNGTKGAAQADPHHYTENLSTEQRQFIEDASAAIEDRIRDQKGDVDFLDRVLVRRITIKLHMVAKASDYVENVSGLVQVINTEHGSHEDKAPLLDEIRQFDAEIFRELKKLGVLNDPESKKADALEQWRGFVQTDQGL